MKKTISIAQVVFSLVLLLSACGSDETSYTTVGGLEIVDVTYSKGITDGEPTTITDEFYPTETVYLTVDIHGRPESGVVSAEAYWNEQFISSVDIDLADVNSGVIMSVGENTYASITLTPSADWPISKNYKFLVSINGEKLGEYPFTVVPPEDAIPSVINAVSLSKDVDENFNPIDPTTTFAAPEPVFLVANGDFGRDTWFNIVWTVSGDSLVDCNTVIKADQDYPDDGLYFSCAPDTGWPAGEHNVTLYMNDELVGTYTFTVE